jgi:predicted molibdopterin-dependent oxidoreductase YjgC
LTPEGTITNTERRVQRLRQAVLLVREGKPDGEIICELGETAAEKTFKTP